MPTPDVMPNQPDSSTPYKAYYFSIFAGLGLMSTYLSLYFRRSGLGDDAIATLAAFQAVLGVLAPPFWGAMADRIGSRRRLGLGLMAASGLLFPVFYLFHGFAVFACIIILFAFFNAPIIPLTDSVTIGHVKRRQRDYGRIRVWGSIGFVASIYALSPVLPARASAPAQALLPVFIAFFLWRLLGIAAGSRIPEEPEEHSQASVWQNFVEAAGLFRKHPLFLFTLCGSLHWMAMQAHYVFFTIYLQALHVPDRWKGPVNTIGVIAEILFLSQSAWFIKRLGPYGLMALATLAATIRLTILGFGAPLWVIVLAQFLHAFTFGAYQIASIHFLTHHVPDRLRAGGQTVYSAITGGLAGALGARFAGMMATHTGSLPAMFRASSLIAAVGCIVSVMLWYRIDRLQRL